MEREERTEERRRDVDERLRRQQEEENKYILAVSLGQEPDLEQEVSDTEDEEVQGCSPLISACHKGMAEVSCVCVCVCECIEGIICQGV